MCLKGICLVQSTVLTQRDIIYFILSLLSYTKKSSNLSIRSLNHQIFDICVNQNIWWSALAITQRDYAETTEHTSTKIVGMMGHMLTKNPLNVLQIQTKAWIPALWDRAFFFTVFACFPGNNNGSWWKKNLEYLWNWYLWVCVQICVGLIVFKATVGPFVGVFNVLHIWKANSRKCSD